MKRITKITINWFIVIALPYSLWVGITGRVDWWTIILIYLLTIKINSSFDL